jgi:hypothetical protein
VSQVQNSSLIAKWICSKENAPTSSRVLKVEVLKLPPLSYTNDFIVLLIELCLSLISFKIRSKSLAINK